MDLSSAKKGDRFKTRTGQIAHFIGFDAELERPYIFRVEDQVWTRLQNGTHCKKCDGVVYPPIVEKLPKEKPVVKPA